VSLPIYPDLPVSTVERIVEILLAAHENADQVSSDVIEAARQGGSALHLWS
jgi:hypothetical protein